MKYIKGLNRKQLVLFPTPFPQTIDKDNPVRLIDFFVESLNIREMGFKVDHTENGRPAYHPKNMPM